MFPLLCINCDFFSLLFLIVALSNKSKAVFSIMNKRIKLKIVLFFFYMRSKIPAFRSSLLCPVQLFLNPSMQSVNASLKKTYRNLYKISTIEISIKTRVTIRAIFPGRVLARISILLWFKVPREHFKNIRNRCHTPIGLHTLTKPNPRYFRRYRNIGQDASGKNGTYGHPI